MTIPALYNRITVEEPQRRVLYGPSETGELAVIDRWPDRDLKGWVAIVSLPQGATEFDGVDRKWANRVRDRIRAVERIPAEFKDKNAIIVPDWGSAIYRLNPRIITARLIPARRLLGSAEHGAARTVDWIIPSIDKAVGELFGDAARRDVHERLPDHVRRHTVGVAFNGRLLPIPFVTEWMRAVRGGPAKRSFDDWTAVLRATEKYRVVPAYSQFRESAQNRLRDIANDWRTCYDSGEVQARFSPNNDWFEICIWNHPYCETASARETHALCWLAIAEEIGARNCRLVAYDMEVLTGAFRIRIEGDLLPATVAA